MLAPSLNFSQPGNFSLWMRFAGGTQQSTPEYMSWSSVATSTLTVTLSATPPITFVPAPQRTYSLRHVSRFGRVSSPVPPKMTVPPYGLPPVNYLTGYTGPIVSADPPPNALQDTAGNYVRDTAGNYLFSTLAGNS